MILPRPKVQYGGLSRRTDTFTINLRHGATAIAEGGATASAKPPDRQVVVRVIVEIRSCAAGGRGLLVLVGAADHIEVRRDPSKFGLRQCIKLI